MKCCVCFYFFCGLVCLGSITSVAAQSKTNDAWAVQYVMVDKGTAFTAAELKLQSSFKSKEQALIYVEKLPVTLLPLGFPSASVDSIIVNKESIDVYLFLGNRFRRFVLNTDSIESAVLENDASLLSNIRRNSFDVKTFSALQDNILAYYANNGYPFAITTLSDVRLLPDTLFGTLRVQKGIEYHIDSFRIIGTANLNPDFLQQKLSIKNNSLYNKKKLQAVDQKFSDLPYVSTLQPSDITMLGSGAVVNLYLNNKRSNQIDFLVGILPGATANGKSQVTGDVNVDLKNLLGNGENFLVKWQSLQPKSPRLNLGFDQPYVFHSAFGVNFLFDLYKRDSSFSQVNAQAGIQFSLQDRQTGKLYIRFQKNSLLQGAIDTVQIIQSKQLPADADVSAVSAGFIYALQKTNYRFNPRRGNEAILNMSVGTKQIKVNNDIAQIKDPSYNYAALYDSITKKTFQLRIIGSAAHYFPVAKRAVVKAGINAGWFASPNIFRNELFLIGGSKLMRGFNDDEFFARQYAVGTVEYRYLIGQNSNLYSFVDLGLAKNNFQKQQVTNNLVGFGFGILNETKIGILNLSIAAGKRNDVAFNIREAVKLHFGYINFF